MPKSYLPSTSNQCAYVQLHDFSILGENKLPEGINDLVLWYRKEGEDFWGVTAKGFDLDEDTAANQFSIKVTWIFRETENALVPTKASEDYIEKISGNALEKLIAIKDKHKACLNLKKKKTPLVKRKHKGEKSSTSE
jgi:hypothetical protein